MHVHDNKYFVNIQHVFFFSFSLRLLVLFFYENVLLSTRCIIIWLVFPSSVIAFYSGFSCSIVIICRFDLLRLWLLLFCSNSLNCNWNDISRGQTINFSRRAGAYEWENSIFFMCIRHFSTYSFFLYTFLYKWKWNNINTSHTHYSFVISNSTKRKHITYQQQIKTHFNGEEETVEERERKRKTLHTIRCDGKRNRWSVKIHWNFNRNAMKWQKATQYMPRFIVLF